MAMTKLEKNDAVLKAVGHPIRRAILRRLAQSGELSPKGASDELEQPLANVAYHFRTLLETGVVKLMKSEPRRGAIEHYYSRTGNAVDMKVAEMLKHIGKE
jgi:DNA-binding transcriptional ArsR family regulator